MHGFSRKSELVLLMKAFASLGHFTYATTTAACLCPYRDSYNYARLLGLCQGTKSLQKLHAQIITCGFEQNPFVAAKLCGKYCEGEGSNIGHARKVFDSLSERDTFLWNLVIQGYANAAGCQQEALSLYDRMRLDGVSANKYTYPFALKACGALRDGKKGRMIHGHAVKTGFGKDLFVGNALVAFYARCKEVELSRKAFDEILWKDIVSWNSMISGYIQNGNVDEALALFQDMLRDCNVSAPDNATLVTVLPACAEAAAIQLGVWIHCYLLKTGMEVDAALGSGLISMYANCGWVNTAKDVFDRVLDRNIIVWSAMIRCYGMHGCADEALQLFSQLEGVGLQPDSILFVCLLSACSHSGMVAKGRELFARMEEYGVKKSEEHYASMVDMLGRAGRLDEALELIRTMPLQPGKNVYGALLGAARIANNLEVAKEAAERLFVLDPDNAGRYIILAKMYENAERWDDAARVRVLLKERQIRKPIGCSSIEVECVHHTFGVEDESHPFTEQIFDTLERLDRIMEDEMVIL